MNYNRKVSYIKGLGIILIVLGHCCGFIQPYLNMFHVAIFFFVIGYTYNYEKYAVNYPLLIGTRIYSLLSQYIIYMIIIMLCHNLFIDIGMIDDIAVKYYGFDYINQFISFFFLNYEPECGAVWFLVPWLSSTLLFGYLCWKYNKYSKSTLLISGTCILLGILGELLIAHEFSSGYRLETTFLVMPIVLFGWLIKKYNLMSKINWWGGAAFYYYCSGCI